MAASHGTAIEPPDERSSELAERWQSRISFYDPLGVDGKGETHFLSDDRERVAVIDGEPDEDLVDEADLVQDINGDVDRWIDHVEDRRGWASFEPDMIVALARERSGMA